MATQQPTLAFIGAGNMAGSIIRGLIRRGYPQANILVSAPTKNHTALLENEYTISCTTKNNDIAAIADIVILGVKPQVLREVCIELADALKEDTLIMSLAAGISSENIQTWLGKAYPVVRCMSNTPAQILEGASGLYANALVNDQQRQITELIMSSVGICAWVDSEALIDTVTAVAGSGPAYFFLFLEFMINAAKDQGMDEQTARNLATQTALGAAKLAHESRDTIEQLRKNVTSPNGTTEKAIQSFESDDLKRIVANAMNACAERARELAKHYEKG